MRKKSKTWKKINDGKGVSVRNSTCLYSPKKFKKYSIEDIIPSQLLEKAFEKTGEDLDKLISKDVFIRGEVVIIDPVYFPSVNYDYWYQDLCTLKVIRCRRKGGGGLIEVTCADNSKVNVVLKEF